MDTLPPPVTGVTPYINPRSVAEARDFYMKAFNAAVAVSMPAEDGKRFMHCHLIINGGPLMMANSFPEHGYPLQEPQGYTLHLQVDDADAWFNRAVEAGCEVSMPMEKQFWGDRYGRVKDPFGVSWSIGGPDKG